MRGSSWNQHNLQSNQANSTGRRLRRPLILGIVILSFLCLIGTGAGLFIYLHHRSNQQRAELLQLAEAAEAEQDWPEAEAHLRQYLELSANEASIHARIGTAIVKGSPNPEDRMRAEKFFARAMQLDPREASYRLAFAELQLTNLPHQALVEARTVLEQEPENLNAIRLLLLAQLRMEDVV